MKPGDRVTYTWNVAEFGKERTKESTAEGVLVAFVGSKSASVRFDKHGGKIVQRVLRDKLTKLEDRE